MKTFLLTSTKWLGEIELCYGDDDLLSSYEMRAELNAEQKQWFLNNMPRCVSDLKILVAATNTGKLTEVTAAPITFELFWNKYDDRENSSKKKTEQRWNNLTKAEREKAYRYISRYFARIPQGTRKKYATTYLSDELWNN